MDPAAPTTNPERATRRPTAPPAPPAISLQGVTLRRRSQLLVDGLWLELAAGRCVAVMGASGAGKTTLLRAVAGLTSDFEGQIDRGIRAATAVVFQEPRLLPWRTARQNVELACRCGEPSCAREWLAAVGLTDAIDLYPSQMSGGMRQRVAVARAMAFDAPLVAVDEPFANLDTATTQALRRDLIDHLRTSGRSALWVTHDRSEAEAVSDRILTLHGPPIGSWQLT